MAHAMCNPIYIIAILLLGQSLSLGHCAAANSQDDGTPTELTSSQDEQTQAPGEAKSWFDIVTRRAQARVDKMLRPQRDYLELFGRYQRWHSKYKIIFDENQQHEPALPDPLDLLAAKFAEVDHEIQVELDESEKLDLENPPNGNGRQQVQDEIIQQKKQPNRVESSGYVYEVLKRIIERLESLDLTDLDGLSIGQTRDEILATEEFQAAMDRMKRIGMNKAKNVMLREGTLIARVVLSQVIANQLLGVRGIDWANSPLASRLLASASGPLMSKYLSNAEFRLIMSLVKQANPLKWIDSKQNKVNQSRSSNSA